jgi:branched-chain amino acid transport system ATP-binding protein
MSEAARSPEAADAQTSEHLLRSSALSKNFGGVQALQGVNLDVRRGEIRGVIGPNGAGKTTLFNLLAGVMRPDAGNIAFGGRDITGASVQERVRLGIARTFQTPQLFMGMSVLENVMAGTHVRHRGGMLEAVFGAARTRQEEDEIRTRAREVLEFVTLREESEALCGTRSYGSQRRVEIARALASNPQLLLLDEPMAGLNPGERAALVELIRRINMRTTIILVEHNMRVVMGLSHRITVLDFGTRIAEGTPVEISKDPAVISAYLGSGSVRAAPS